MHEVAKVSVHRVARAGESRPSRDDEGTLGVVEQVKRNGHVIATLEKSNIHAASARTFSVGWKAPTKPKGVFQHCVVAEDVAGNKSAVSCAKISLK